MCKTKIKNGSFYNFPSVLPSQCCPSYLPICSPSYIYELHTNCLPHYLLRATNISPLPPTEHTPPPPTSSPPSPSSSSSQFQHLLAPVPQLLLYTHIPFY